MAVTAPNPPTPPVAPVVPKVTMSDGGSATVTNQPVSGKQSAAQLQENQARQAVARGDGALAKTTQSKPANNSEAAEQPIGQTTAKDSVVTNSGERQGNATDKNSNANNTGETQTTQTQIPPSPKYHDSFYWLGFLVVSVVIVAVAGHYFNKVRSSDKRVSFNDINDTTEWVNNEKVSDKYKGMTASEVIQQLDNESHVQKNKSPSADQHFEITI